MDPFVSYEKIKCCEYGPRVCIHNISLSLLIIDGPISLRYISLGWIVLPGTNTLSLLDPFVSCKKCCEYSPGAISLLLMNGPNKLTPHYNSRKVLPRTNTLSLLDPIISYEENRVLWIQSRGLYSQLFAFFVTHEWPQ